MKNPPTAALETHPRNPPAGCLLIAAWLACEFIQPTSVIAQHKTVPTPTTKIDSTPLLRAQQGAEEAKMSDLPKWAQGEGEGESSGALADKLVDESGGDKPSSPAAPAASDAGSEHPPRDDSGLVSRTLCFFRFLAVLTVVLALVVIGTNCYIIYERYDEIKGECWL